jgi:hypothetical protein
MYDMNLKKKRNDEHQLIEIRADPFVQIRSPMVDHCTIEEIEYMYLFAVHDKLYH